MNKQKVYDWIVVYMIPTFIYRLWVKIRHPKRTWYNYQKNKWVKNVKVGDIVCDCSCKHVEVASIDEWGDIIDVNGINHDLYHCCQEVKPDNSCHSAYLNV